MINYIQNWKKYFYRYAIFMKESCIILILQQKKMKENVLNMEYHGNSLETSSRCVLSIFEKKKSIFPFERQKLIRSHFVQK